MEPVEVLKKSDLFCNLNDDQLKVIAKMCTPLVFEAGCIVHKQGAVARKMYVIEKGLVGIILEVGPMAQRQVQAAVDFESFGWSSMTEPYTWSATAKALETTTAFAFDGKELDDLCSTHPEIGNQVHKALAHLVGKRLRQAYVQLLGVTYCT